MQHTDLGRDLMNRIIEETKDIAKLKVNLNLKADKW